MMELIQKAKDLASELEKHDELNPISPVIRRLIIELEMRRHLELKIDSGTDSPELIRLKRKGSKK